MENCVQDKIDALTKQQEELEAQTNEVRKQLDAVQKERATALLGMLFREGKLCNTVWEWHGENCLESRMSKGGFEELDAKVRPWFHDRFYLGDFVVDFSDGVVNLRAIPQKDPGYGGPGEILRLARQFDLTVKTDWIDGKIGKAREEFNKWSLMKSELAKVGVKTVSTKLDKRKKWAVYLTGRPKLNGYNTTRLVRDLMDCDILDADRMVETLPLLLRSGVTYRQAARIARTFQDVGASLRIETVDG